MMKAVVVYEVGGIDKSAFQEAPRPQIKQYKSK